MVFGDVRSPCGDEEATSRGKSFPERPAGLGLLYGAVQRVREVLADRWAGSCDTASDQDSSAGGWAGSGAGTDG